MPAVPGRTNCALQGVIDEISPDGSSYSLAFIDQLIQVPVVDYEPLAARLALCWRKL